MKKLKKIFNILVSAGILATTVACGGAGPVDSSYDSERSIPLVSKSPQFSDGLYHIHEDFNLVTNCSNGPIDVPGDISSIQTSVFFAFTSDDTIMENNRSDGDSITLLEYADPLLTRFKQEIEITRGTNGKTFSGDIASTVQETDTYELDIEFDGDNQLVGAHTFNVIEPTSNTFCTGDSNIFAELDSINSITVFNDYVQKVLSGSESLEHGNTATVTVMSITTTTNIPIVAEITLPPITTVVTRQVASFPEVITQTTTVTSTQPVTWYIEDFTGELAGNYQIYIYDADRTLLNSNNHDFSDDAPAVSTTVTISPNPFIVVLEPTTYFYPEQSPINFPFITTIDTNIEFSSILPYITPTTTSGPVPQPTTTTTTTVI